MPRFVFTQFENARFIISMKSNEIMQKYNLGLTSLHFSAGLSLDAANPRDLVWSDGHAKHRSLSGNSGSGLNLKLGHRDRHVRFTDRIFPGLNQSRPGRRYHHFWSSERI